MKTIVSMLLLLPAIAIGQSKISVKEYGAVGDGIADDGAAIYKTFAAAYAFPQYQTPEIIFPAGIYRITKPLIIGGYSVKAKNCYTTAPGYTFAKTDKFDMDEFLKGARSPQLQIKGEGNVSIYGDFNDSLELQPIISYQAAGDGRSLTANCQWKAEISNIGIYGKGSFDANGKPQPRIAPPFRKNNQVGLLCIYTTNLKLDNVSFWGLKEGMLMNNAYYTNANNLKFDYCQRGIYEIQCHDGSYKVITATFCDIGAEFRSNHQVVQNVYMEYCKIGIHVGAANNTFISTYFENTLPGESQIILGYNPTDSFYIAGLNGQVDCTNFINLTIATQEDGKPGTGITMKENARRVFISGGNVWGSTNLFANLSNQIISIGVNGLYQASPNLFKLDPDANFKSLKLQDLKAPPGTKQPLYIDDKGNIVK
jgi:hypothetical protein